MNKKLLYLKALLMLSALVTAIVITVKFELWTLFSDRSRLIEFVNSFKELSALIFIVLQITQVIIAVIPGELTGFIGGYLFGTVTGTVYSTIGLAIGSFIAFYLARFFGRPLVLIFVKKNHLERFDYLMSYKGASVSAFLFIMPGFPKDYLCYILGLSKMPPRVFLVISTFGRLVSTAFLSIAGSLIRDQNYKTFITFSALILLLMMFLYIYRNEIEQKLRKLFNAGDN